MNRLILFALTLLASAAHADPLDEQLSKMTKVIKTDDRCEFAVVTVPKDRTRKSVWPRGAVCVGTTISDKGTLREETGCTAFFLNAETLQMAPLMPQLGYNRAVNKKCGSGGFEAVMADLLFTDNTVSPSKKVPVSWAFTTAYRLPDSEFDVQLLYTYENNKTYQNWFAEARGAALSKLNKPTKKSK